MKILRHLYPSNDKVAEAVHNNADYFQRNAERMRYPQFRAQCLFVGSGLIEAGCRTVIGARLSPRRLRHHRPALLPPERALRGLLGITITRRLIPHFYVAHPFLPDSGFVGN